MDQVNSTSIAQLAAGLVVGLLAVAMGLQKIFKGWRETSAESSVISLMHEELERMSKHNSTLTRELNKLQLEIVNLNKELHKLTLENQRLHTEVVALTGEVARLQTILQTGAQNAGTN